MASTFFFPGWILQSLYEYNQNMNKLFNSQVYFKIFYEFQGTEISRNLSSMTLDLEFTAVVIEEC